MFINSGAKVQKKIEQQMFIVALFTLLISVLILFNTACAHIVFNKLFYLVGNDFSLYSFDTSSYIPLIGSFGNCNGVRGLAVFVNVLEFPSEIIYHIPKYFTVS